jgi:adenylate cyclase
MRGRHLETLIALVLAGLWGFGVYFAHSHGHLRFLDRVESTMIEFRTLVRGPRAEKFLLPLKKFADHAEIGIVNVATDRSGIPRSMPMLFRTSDRVEMSFPLRVAALAIGKEPTIEPNRLVLGERSVPTDVDHALPISFYGPHRSIRTVSAASVLGGEIAPDIIRNRIVIVGATVTGGGDLFPTPFDPVLPGVEVVATAITHLMAGDGILRDQSVRFADGMLPCCSRWFSSVCWRGVEARSA